MAKALGQCCICLSWAFAVEGGGKMRLDMCRIWWPLHLLQLGESSVVLLVGWVNSFRSCVDVVVAAVFDLESSSLEFEELQEHIERAHLQTLDDSCGSFCILGLYYPPVRKKPDEITHLQDFGGDQANGHLSAFPDAQSFFQDDKVKMGRIWLTLVAAEIENEHGDTIWSPKLQSMIFEGNLCNPKTHLVLYKQPCFRSHHFSLCPWDFTPSLSRLQSTKAKDDVKKPYWILELEEQERGPNIELVTQRLNSAAFLESRVQEPASFCNEKSKNTSLVSIAYQYLLLAIAGAVGLLAVAYYVLARAWFVTSVWLLTLPCVKNIIKASYTFHILQIRFQELSAWPLILLWGAEGPDHPNVAVVQRLALMMHCVWSKIIVDLILGAAVGSVVLVYQTSITLFIVEAARFLTNDVLRTGCIWLMGVPAGFKLNNELAEVIGTAALNVIQAFSTLWGYWLPSSGLSLKAFAIVSVLFGSSVSAAVLVDVLFLATAHVTVLHRATAAVYGNQLKILAALWRLFRGRKQNPLRNRIDSYEYTVEQLVVASLMFTPLLLLLPTTSVFYIFFTMIHTSLCFPRFLLQTMVAFLSCFPYAEVWLWLVARNRFPSGLQFHIISRVPQSENADSQRQTELLVSRLNSTLTTFGELIHPFVKRLCGGLTRSRVLSATYNMVSGGRLPVNLDFGLRSELPQTSVSAKKFWQLSFLALSTATA